MSDFVKEALKKARQLREEAKVLERIAARYQEKPQKRHYKRRIKKADSKKSNPAR